MSENNRSLVKSSAVSGEYFGPGEQPPVHRKRDFALVQFNKPSMSLAEVRAEMERAGLQPASFEDVLGPEAAAEAMAELQARFCPDHPLIDIPADSTQKSK